MTHLLILVRQIKGDFVSSTSTMTTELSFLLFVYGAQSIQKIIFENLGSSISLQKRIPTYSE